MQTTLSASNCIKEEQMTDRNKAGTAVDAAAAVGVLLLGFLLSVIGAGLVGQWQDSSARGQAVTAEDLLGAAAAAAGTGLLLWWFISLACAAAALLLEQRGKARAAHVTRRMSPAFMQRLVVAALSFQLLSGTAAHAAGSAPGPHWSPTAGQETSAPAEPGVPAAMQDATIPVPGKPDAGRPAPPSTIQPGWQPSAPPVEPGLLAGPPVRSEAALHQETARHGSPVPVLAGDSLWGIVADHMGPGASDVDIALEWPRWYEANKALLGPNPDVLLPGQVLLPPPPA